MSKPAKTQSKSAFIRSQSPELTASEVVRKAKEVGIAINEQRVYAIRSAARKKQNRPGRAPRGGAAVAAASGATGGGPGRRAGAGAGDQASTQFLSLVADIGLKRAEQLFSELRSKFTSIKLS